MIEDIRSSVEEEQHDWQPEQAVAPKPETLSLQSTRKSYISNKSTTRLAINCLEFNMAAYQSTIYSIKLVGFLHFKYRVGQKR